MYSNYSNLSNVRLAGEPYLAAAPMAALTPLKMKSLGGGKHKKSSKKQSNHSMSVNALSVSATTASSSKSRSRVSGNHNAVAAAAAIKEVKKKAGNNSKKNHKPFVVAGDAVVEKLDSSNQGSSTGFMDQNANAVEPFDEEISKDIALAVAIIVAEHEMLKLKYPDRYDVDTTATEDEKEKEKKKGKGKSGKSKAATPTTEPTPSTSTAAGVTGEKPEESQKNNEANQQKTPEVVAEEKKDEIPSTSSAAAAAAVATAEKPGQKKTVPSETSTKLPETPNSQKTVDVSASRSKVSTVVSPSALQLKRTESTVANASSTAASKNEPSAVFTVPSRAASTTMPPTTASAGTLSTTGSSHIVSTPPMPTIGAKMGGQLEVLKYLGRIQNYMNHLGYHRLGEPEIKINSRLSMKMQMVTARDIIQANLPIKCLHAVVLAVHFTNCIDTVERFPIYFRSHVQAKEYKHIVLGIYVQGHFGALGISRDGGLQDKPTSYAKLSDLIFEFAKCYGQSGHILNEVKFGNLITHDQHSLERLFSKSYVVPIAGCLHSDIERQVEKFAKQLRAKMGLACLKSLPSHPASSLGSRLSRSKTSLHGSNGGSGAGSERSFTNLRVRALSMGPLTTNRSSNSNLDTLSSRRPSKTAVTKSKPAKSTKRK